MLGNNAGNGKHLLEVFRVCCDKYIQNYITLF